MLYLLFLTALVQFIILCGYARRGAKGYAVRACYFLVYVLSIPLLIVLTGLYITKSNRYSLLLHSYLNIPALYWNAMRFMNVSKTTLIRLINLFTMAAPCASLMFALHYLRADRRLIRHVGAAVICASLALVLLFDPGCYRWLYYAMCPYPVSYALASTLQAAAETAGKLLTRAAIVISNGLLLWHLARMPRIRKLFWSDVTLFLSHLTLSVFYCFIFSALPMYLFKPNKILHSMRYLNIPIGVSVYNQGLFTMVLMVFSILTAFLLLYNSTLRLRHTNHMRSLNANRTEVTMFSKLFSHYVKNELLTMKEAVSIAMQTQSEAERNEMLTILQANIAEMWQHTNRIHEIMSLRKVTFKQIAIRDWVSRTMEAFKNVQPGARVEVNVRYDAVITIDPLSLGEALLNLLKNAYEALEPLRLSQEAVDERILLNVFSLDNWIYIQVTDHGIGLTPPEIKKAFRPFYSTKAAKTNWGLGLYLCERIVAFHHGYIELVSNPNANPRRTTACIALPQQGAVLHPSPRPF